MSAGMSYAEARRVDLVPLLQVCHAAGAMRGGGYVWREMSEGAQEKIMELRRREINGDAIFND